MKIILIIFLTSLLVIFLVMMLNYATYNGKSKASDETLNTTLNKND